MTAFQLFTLPKQTNLDASANVLAGAKAAFFLTNSSTPHDTYTTSALSIAHQNPVVADANGVFAPIYLDPEIVYKLTLTTAADALLYTVDPCNDQLLSQAVVGNFLYPQTQKEIAVSVEPDLTAYPEGDLRRYDVTASGTDETTEIVDAVTALGADWSSPITVPFGVKFDTMVVHAALPEKSPFFFHNIHQSGSGYRQQIWGVMSQPPDANTDTTFMLLDGHYPGMSFNNPRTAGTTSATAGLCGDSWDCGFFTDGTKGPRVLWQRNYRKSTVRTAEYGGEGVGCMWLETRVPERARNYEVWRSGLTGALNQYIVASNNLIYRRTSGTGASTVSPTHTTGAVTGADGIEWTFESSFTSFGKVFYVDELRRIGTNAADTGVTHNWEQNPEDTEHFTVRYAAKGASKNIIVNFLPTDGSGVAQSMPGIQVQTAVGIRVLDSTSTREMLRLTEADGCRVPSDKFSVSESSTAPVITNGTTIATATVGTARVAPGGAVTGIILASGTVAGQTCWVINESTAANTVTFAVAGTSHVADGATTVIAGLRAAMFVWDSQTSLWYRT
jgi:hypothetical protein